MGRVRVTLYGGLNEIGGNKFLVEDGDDAVFLDFGMAIGTRGSFYGNFLPPRSGVVLRDLLRLGMLPAVDGIYREDLLMFAEAEGARDPPESADVWLRRRGRLRLHGVLLTHAHVDHFQDLTFLDPRIPVFCTATTRVMLQTIDEVVGDSTESEVLSAREISLGESTRAATFPGEPSVKRKARPRIVHTCPEGSPFKVGPFEVVAVPVDHSVPGGCAFRVRTPSGRTIFYTGDVRFHGRLEDRTRALRAAGAGLRPDLLLTEGTRAADKDQDHEGRVEEDVARLVGECRGLAVAEFGWKDTTRFDTLQRVASATGRTLVVSAKLALMLKRLDHREDVPSQAIEKYGNVAVYLRRRKSMSYSPADYGGNRHEMGYAPEAGTETLRAAWLAQDEVTLRDPLQHVRNGVRAEHVRTHPEQYLLHLTSFELNELIDLAPPSGSRWVRCMTEPYSDDMTLDLDRQKNWLHRFGFEHNVRTDTKGEEEFNGTLEGTTHVSGHAAGLDLLPFVKSVEALRVAPIHLEARNLDLYEGLGKDLVAFPTFDYRHAAQGKAVIEL